MKRRHLLTAIGTGIVTGLPNYSQRASASIDSKTSGTADPAATESPGRGPSTERSVPESVTLETLASGFEVPLDVAFAPELDRRYIAEQGGRVRVHESDGLREEPFLDLRDVVEVGLEKGRLGIALHPDFAESRRVFVRYSAARRSGTPSAYSHTFVLAEFEATEDGTRAKRDSERAILEIPQPQGNHNSGNIAFGPDGYLYVGVGDGGGGGDRDMATSTTGTTRLTGATDRT